MPFENMGVSITYRPAQEGESHMSEAPGVPCPQLPGSHYVILPRRLWAPLLCLSLSFDHTCKQPWEIEEQLKSLQISALAKVH